MNLSSVFWRTFVGLGLVCGLCQGASASSSASEASLLHLRPDLNVVEVYRRSSQSWRPFTQSAGKLLVVNLWSRSCEPCLAEMPLLKTASARWQRRGVEFLIVADPPDRMSRDELVKFWERPFVEVKAGHGCPGQHERAVAGSFAMRCRIELPELDPGRSSDPRLSAAVATETQPLTLVLDPNGTVRQAFVGSLQPGELDRALDRLLAAVQAEKCGARPAHADPRLQKP